MTHQLVSSTPSGWNVWLRSVRAPTAKSYNQVKNELKNLKISDKKFKSDIKKHLNIDNLVIAVRIVIIIPDFGNDGMENVGMRTLHLDDLSL